MTIIGALFERTIEFSLSKRVVLAKGDCAIKWNSLHSFDLVRN